MIATVILASGPNTLQIDPIPGSIDRLAIVRKWKDDPYSLAVVAPIPNTDAWTPVSTTKDLNSTTFPAGHVAEELQRHVEKLPSLVQGFMSGTANPNPAVLSLARYLGYYTEDQARIILARREADRQSRDDEWNRRKAAEQSAIEEEKRRIDETYHGFLSGMSPLKAGKVRAALDVQLRSEDGIVRTRKELIEKLVAEGQQLENHPTGGRILVDRRTNRFHYQKDLSKTAFDYAAFLGA
jgi:hypothetical protein